MGYRVRFNVELEAHALERLFLFCSGERPTRKNGDTFDYDRAMTNADDSNYFERHFHDRAALAEELAGRGFSIDPHIIAATALDALAEVWMNDFPADRAAMEKDLGGKPPPSIRMARLVKRFGAKAPHVGKVAVVLFAADWKKHVPEAAADAEALLARRLGRMRGELPRAHLDVSREELATECPALAQQPLLATLAEEYEYPAVLYRFIRSPFVHYGTSSSRTHGFTRGDEVFYMPLAKGMTIGISVAVVTAWLRATATRYVEHCSESEVRPATGIEPARQAEDVLKTRWKLVADGLRK